MVSVIGKNVSQKCSLESALDICGLGKYNVFMLATSCLLIMTMYNDLFALSVTLPAVACEMALTTAEQSLLAAIPLIGVMLSSYAWGLCADILGRRTTLLLAMPVGVLLNLAVSMAPNFATFAVLKFLSASFTSSANAAGFVLVGESISKKYRSRFLFLMATSTMCVQLTICLIALPIIQQTFRYDIPLLNLEYRPWRMLMQVIFVPSIIGVIATTFLYESPKFLLSKGKDEAAMEVLKNFYAINSGLKKEDFPVSNVYVDDQIQAKNADKSFLRTMWNQTAPIFKPPLLKNSLKLYYLLLCGFMTSTGYTVWVPTMTNAYFNGLDTTGKSFCEVASTATQSTTEGSSTCDNLIKPFTLYAVMCYSGSGTLLNILLTFAVGPFTKKQLTITIFSVSALSGVLLLFVRVPMLSIALFYAFIDSSLILGMINTFLVEVNPTHLRGMATCLSVVVARGFGFMSVQLIGALLAQHCTPMISGYVALILSGLAVSFVLPKEISRQEIETTNKLETTKDIVVERTRI